MTDQKPVKHVGIILDGNRRWAKEHGLTPIEGHYEGRKAIRGVFKTFKEHDVTHLSLFAFSTENWKRAEDEVGGLMDLFRLVATKDVKDLHKEGIKVVFSGAEENLPADLYKSLRKAEEKTKENTEGTLNICINYGGQQEITDAVRAIIREGVSADDVTPETISQHLYRPELPPLDLVIRTSGEQRISNFMLWQLAYAEFTFTKTMWPAFTNDELGSILHEFESRTRRFGGSS